MGFNLSIWARLIIFIIGMALGFFFILKSLFVVNTIGESSWAEQKIPGGTFGAVKLFGIVIMIVSIIVLFKG